MAEPGSADAYEAARLAFELGRSVRELREQQGWSQSELARHAGMTQSAVARFEAEGTVPTLPAFDTFVALVSGLIAAPTRRTVCGMLTASGMAGVWHHSRAYRFFASTRWSLDQLGLTLLGPVIGWLVPFGAPVVALDDTLFRRRGRKVHAAVWAYDGSRSVIWSVRFIVKPVFH